jgi:hypothetical protein
MDLLVISSDTAETAIARKAVLCLGESDRAISKEMKGLVLGTFVQPNAQGFVLPWREVCYEPGIST